MRDLFQPPVHGMKFVGQECSVACPPSPGKIQGNHGLPGVDKIYEDAAEALKRIACMRNDDDVHPIQTTRLEKGKSIADDGTYIRL
jgi:hypothetical protein